MKVGLQIPIFTWAGGPPELAPTLSRISKTAEDAGFDSIWVMDHHFQMEMVGRAEMDMLEAYTTLGYIAGQTSRVGLGALVTGVTYRYPGILIKEVTTLDVLSGGRAWLGIGAAWYEREHLGLGVPFPALKERFERLEEALQIAKQMWNSDNNGAYDYAADTRGYTVGLTADFEDRNWGFRFGEGLMPKVANGIDIDFDLTKTHSEQLEVEL